MINLIKLWTVQNQQVNGSEYDLQRNRQMAADIETF